MADAFIGQISSFSFPFPPKYSALCNGQLLGISQNLALFSLLGTQFGGNGSTTFALPNLQGQVPLHAGPSYPQGLHGGSPFHTLSVSELPAHTHTIHASGATGVTANPSPNSRLGVSRPGNLYAAPQSTVPMAPQMIGVTGASQPHENRQPYLVVNYCIALSGTFPSRN
jgi:microcystin-dependent protein